MRRVAWFASLFVVLLLLANSLPTLAAEMGDAKKGKTPYQTFCAVCHGPTGKGDGPSAVALNPKPANHADGKLMNKLTNEYLTKVIKNGGASVGKSPLMPPWGGSLNDGQIRDVLAFIRSLAVPPYTAK